MPEETEIIEKPEDAGTSKRSFGEKFKSWANMDLKMTFLFCLIGFLMGIISYLLNMKLVWNVSILIIIILLFICCAILIKRKFKIKETKGWWFSKFIVYFFTSIIVWTILYNVNIVWA